jgi:hypothetical protein
VTGYVRMSRRLVGDQPSVAAWAVIADLRFAAWFLWMTPLEAALSSSRDATWAYSAALTASPAEAASRNRRTDVRSDDLTALLRWRAFSFVLFRLIWDLMFATDEASELLVLGTFGLVLRATEPLRAQARPPTLAVTPELTKKCRDRHVRGRRWP